MPEWITDGNRMKVRFIIFIEGTLSVLIVCRFVRSKS